MFLSHATPVHAGDTLVMSLTYTMPILQVTDTKVMLESCLVRLEDFSASYDQVIRRLKEMEKRLRENHLKADLTEKKAELQRCKVSTGDNI